MGDNGERMQKRPDDNPVSFPEGYFFSYYWQDVGGAAIDSPYWAERKAGMVAMRDAGATHAGVYIYHPSQMPGAVAKIAELRAMGLNFMMDGSECFLARDFSGRADPSQTGPEWQDYLAQVATLCDTFGLGANDVAAWDIEWWNRTAAEKTNDWRARGKELAAVVHANNPTPVILYGEQTQHRLDNLLPGMHCWPGGTGDVPSPSIYLMDDMDAFDASINDGVSDWTGAVAVISFTYSDSIHGWMRLPDTTRSYTAGTKLRAAGFRGAWEYPGWSKAAFYGLPEGLFADYDEFVAYYKAQMKALIAGLAGIVLLEAKAEMTQKPDGKWRMSIDVQGFDTHG